MLKASQEWCNWLFLLLQRRQTLLCVLKASQVWCGWSFFLPQRHHPLLCVLKASQVWCGWSFLKDVVVPKVLSKVRVMLKVPPRCGCSRRIPKGCGCTLHLSYTLKTLYFFLSLQTTFFTLRMMRPSIFRISRPLLLQDSTRSVSTRLPRMRVNFW